MIVIVAFDFFFPIQYFFEPFQILTPYWWNLNGYTFKDESFILEINIQGIAYLGCYLPKSTFEALITADFFFRLSSYRVKKNQ